MSTRIDSSSSVARVFVAFVDQRSLSVNVVCLLDALLLRSLRDTSWKYFISCCMPARSKWTRPSCSFVWDKSQCHRLSIFPKYVEKSAVRATLFFNAIQNVTIFELSCFNYFGTFLELFWVFEKTGL